MKGVRILDHTADVGLEAEGGTLEEAFERAIVGMTGLVVDTATIRQSEERTVRAEGPDDGSLLVGLLSEVLFLIDRDGFVASRAEVSLRGGSAEARLRGEIVDASRHAVKTEIKAVTWHMLAAERDPPRVRVIFDI